ncbi:MAG TPA: hypothetical protein VFX98_15225 [Longimicrobiaceae bacterium]|nr:hypothetical protein [Longimicrobiaceae bacterium]
MFTRCLFCHVPLAENQSLQHLRHGRKVAFDPARGRLWVVCAACARWNLAPIEERWEVLEELERLTTDGARLLAQTDNVALLRAEDLEVVRVGRAQLAEEAWWRYGRELVRRRKQSYLLQGVEVVAGIATAVATGGVGLMWYGRSVLVPVARWYRFGRVAWRGESRCERCGARLGEMKFSETRRLVVGPGEEGEGVALRLGCARCGRDREGGHRLEGAAAEHLLRRALAYHHFHGASEKRIREATDVIEGAGSVEAWTRRLAERRLKLGVLEDTHRTQAVALEIAANDQAERVLLELELAELERRWREEEEIAAIVDRELTFVPGLERLLGRARNTL